MKAWVSKALLLSLLGVVSVSVMGCQQDPLVGKWECIAYQEGYTLITWQNEVLEFAKDGTFKWTSSMIMPRKTFIGTYTTNTQATPYTIDVTFTKYSQGGVETDIPDVTSLGVYKFDGSGNNQRLFMNHYGGLTRPMASTLDKEVGPVWVGTKVNAKMLDVVEKGLDTLLGAWGASALPGS